MNQSPVIIRTATVADASALLNIYSYYVKNTAITFEWEVPSLEEFENRIRNTLVKYPYLVALIDGKICGYAYVSAFKSRRAYDWSTESSIYIAKDYKRSGIGSALLNELETILIQMNVLNINACIAAPEVDDEYVTKDSIKFHTKMGYKMVGEFHKCGYKFNRWYNMVWMEKMLGDHIENQPEITWFSKLN